MSEYYMMDCWGLDGDEPVQKPMDADLDDYDEDDEIEWFCGQIIGIDLPNPIEIEWNPELSGGGPAWEAFGYASEGLKNENGVRRQWAYPANDPPLFHRDLVAALQKCGVDNFNVYETNIEDTKSGSICKDYLAINIIGLIKAADMEKSKAVIHSEDGLVDTDFDSVELDGSAIRGCKIFRLAESINALVIHREVKDYLESKGGFGLTFTPPEKWIG